MFKKLLNIFKPQKEVDTLNNTVDCFYIDFKPYCKILENDYIPWDVKQYIQKDRNINFYKFNLEFEYDSKVYIKTSPITEYDYLISFSNDTIEKLDVVTEVSEKKVDTFEMFKVTKVYQKTDSIFLGMTADNDPAILHFPMTGKTYKTITYVYKIGSLNEMHTMKDVRKYLNTYGLTLKKF